MTCNFIKLHSVLPYGSLTVIVPRCRYQRKFAFVLPADNVLSPFRLNVFIVKCIHLIEKYRWQRKNRFLNSASSTNSELKWMRVFQMQILSMHSNVRHIHYLYNIINKNKKSNRPPVTANVIRIPNAITFWPSVRTKRKWKRDLMSLNLSYLLMRVWGNSKCTRQIAQPPYTLAALALALAIALITKSYSANCDRIIIMIMKCTGFFFFKSINNLIIYWIYYNGELAAVKVYQFVCQNSILNSQFEPK